MTTLSSLDIQSYLPHRYPFLLIDKVLEIIPKKTITAIKNATVNEPYFQGHFKDEPIMPGVLIIEAMAQATHILASYQNTPHPSVLSEKYILASVESIKFKHFVLPGDQLKLKAEIAWEKAGFLRYNVEARVENQCVCEGQITIAKKPSSAVKGQSSC